MTVSITTLLLAVVAASHAPSGRAPGVNSAHASRAPVALRAVVRRDGLMRAPPSPCGALAPLHTTASVGLTES